MNRKPIDHGTLSEEELAGLMVKLAVFSTPINTYDGRCRVDMHLPEIQENDGVLFVESGNDIHKFTIAQGATND